MNKFIIILIRLIIFYYPSYWLLDLFACEHICCFCCLWSSLGWFQTHTPSIIQKYIFVFNFSPFIFFYFFVLMPTKLSVRRKKIHSKITESQLRQTDLKTDRLFCLSEICVYCFVHDKYTVYFADTYKAVFLGSIHYMLLIIFFLLYISEWMSNQYTKIYPIFLVWLWCWWKWRWGSRKNHQMMTCPFFNLL